MLANEKKILLEPELKNPITNLEQIIEDISQQLKISDNIIRKEVSSIKLNKSDIEIVEKHSPPALDEYSIENKDKEESSSLDSSTLDERKSESVKVLERERRRATDKYRKYSFELIQQLTYMVNEQNMTVKEATETLKIPYSTGFRWAKEDLLARSNSSTTDYSKNYRHAKKAMQEIQREYIRQTFIDAPNISLNTALIKLKKKFPGSKISSVTFARLVTGDLGIIPYTSLEYKRLGSVPERIQIRYDWAQDCLKSKVDFESNCVFIGESQFHFKCLNKQTEEYQRVSFDNKYIAAISYDRVLNYSKVETDGSEAFADYINPNYFEDFVISTLQSLEKLEDFKPRFVVLSSRLPRFDNVMDAVLNTKYRPIIIPEYSEKVNPMDHFWQILRNKVNNDMYYSTATSRDGRVIEFTKQLPKEKINLACQRSMHYFNRCLEKVEF